MKIKNHFLVPDDGDNVQIRKSPNLSTPFTPLLLVIHYTANNSLDETVSWFMNPDAQASSHLVIGRDGRIVQMVAFNKKAWHAGASSWGNLEGINRYSIGIELVNAGKLRRRSDDKWVNWAGRVVPDEEVTEAVHRAESTPAGWHEYTDAQIESAERVSILLNSAYHFTDVLGHEDISPGRKVDPGPLFPLNSFRSRVLGRA
ncbi:MAG TPA: N-acetylmuramoyl-L-alanine amidase [Spirochaetota bacterium]|nr:N-acetylmuramoyl-L-alanine amidase [Spirochaetota bacterium]HSA13582.1 N-acetylmuramoyl-L-alanine amidase [Spirochaetota bacterium]